MCLRRRTVVDIDVRAILQHVICVFPQVAVNEYADLTWEEFRSVKLGLQPGLDGSFRFAHSLCWQCLKQAAFGAYVYRSMWLGGAETSYFKGCGGLRSG